VPLDRLLASAGGYLVPVTLAVIPAVATNALAERLLTEPAISVAVHGWAHENHAPADQKKQELGPHRPAQVVLAELGKAKATIGRLFGAQAVSMLVPPWNRIGADLVPLLGEAGFSALSVYGRAKPASIRLVNTHVDLIDWHAGRGCKDHGKLVGGLVDELRWRRETGSREPIGVLTHHLVHDEAAWLFLERLFEATGGNAACRWVSVQELI
jgi:hypothetical protein